MKNHKQKNKIVIVLGQTATGKSDLAVKLAKKYNGEIISADSRQVYKGLNIGTGKITKKEMSGIPHYMLDVLSPKKTFTVSDWKEKTETVIKEIIEREKLPIICGGTGFYLQSIIDGAVLPEVPPNKKLRKTLEKKSLVELVQILEKLDKVRLENIDTKNKVRLIRAIEIAETLGKVPKIKTKNPKFEILQIGLKLSDEELRERIHTRLLSRVKKGLIAEAKKLRDGGLSYKRMRELGLEYRFLADLLNHKIAKKEFMKDLETAIWQYAKRQMTWFKRDPKIKWFNPNDLLKIEKEIHSLLNR